MKYIPRHLQVAEKVVEILRANLNEDYEREDIRIEDFPFTREISRGVVVSVLDESEGIGTNEHDDIKYRVQITRVKTKLHPKDGIEQKSSWRFMIRRLFHRKLIGLALLGGCEILPRPSTEQ